MELILKPETSESVPSRQDTPAHFTHLEVHSGKINRSSYKNKFYLYGPTHLIYTVVCDCIN